MSSTFFSITLPKSKSSYLIIHSVTFTRQQRRSRGQFCLIICKCMFFPEYALKLFPYKIVLIKLFRMNILSIRNNSKKNLMFAFQEDPYPSRERETHNNQEQQAFSKKGRKLYIAKQVDNCLLCEITGVSSLICDFPHYICIIRVA